MKGLHSSEDLSGFQASQWSLLTNPDLMASMRMKSRQMAVKFDLERVVDAYERGLQGVAGHDEWGQAGV
jgi:hypothetical protein